MSTLINFTDQVIFNNGKTIYNVILKRDKDGLFVATCIDLQGVVADGSTKKEAMKNIKHTIDDMLDGLGMDKEYNLVQIITFENTVMEKYT